MKKDIVTPKESILGEPMRVLAMRWWNDVLTQKERENLQSEYRKGVTGREIEEIWNAEIDKCFTPKESNEDDVKLTIKQFIKDTYGENHTPTLPEWNIAYDLIQWQKERSYSREEVETLLEKWGKSEYQKIFTPSIFLDANLRK